MKKSQFSNRYLETAKEDTHLLVDANATMNRGVYTIDFLNAYQAVPHGVIDRDKKKLAASAAFKMITSRPALNRYTIDNCFKRF